MEITRRHLLAATAAIAAGGVASGAWLVTSWWNQRPEEAWAILSPDEIAFLDALADCAYPSGGVPALAGADANLPRYLDLLLGALEPENQRLMRLLLHALDAWPVMSHGARFAHLDPAARSEVLRRWVHHDLAEVRAAATSIVVLLGMGYTIHPLTAETFSTIYGCHYGA